jgi:hypothetical protein
MKVVFDEADVLLGRSAALISLRPDVRQGLRAIQALKRLLNLPAKLKTLACEPLELLRALCLPNFAFEADASINQLAHFGLFRCTPVLLDPLGKLVFVDLKLCAHDELKRFSLRPAGNLLAALFEADHRRADHFRFLDKRLAVSTFSREASERLF